MTYVLGFFGLGIQELVIVMVILLVLFGGKQLPVLMRMGDDQPAALAPGIGQRVAHRVEAEQPDGFGPRAPGAVARDGPFRLDRLAASRWRLRHAISCSCHLLAGPLAGERRD